MERTPYNQVIDYRYVRLVRQLKRLTLKEFGQYMEVDPATLSRIENGLIHFSDYYEERFKKACRKLKVSNEEISYVRNTLQTKYRKGEF